MKPKKIVIPQDNDSEADTCRKEVTDKLYASELTEERILEQRTFTDGKIVVLGKVANRQKPSEAIASILEKEKKILILMEEIQQLIEV